MMQHVLMKIKLKPGSKPRLMEYVKEFDRRRKECDDSLAAEGADLESFFMDGDTLYVFKHVKDLAEARKYQKSSDMPIYKTVTGLWEDCIEKLEDIHSILAFETNPKA